MIDTPKTNPDEAVTAPPVVPPSPLTEPDEKRTFTVGDSEVVPRILSEKPRTAPAPVKI